VRSTPFEQRDELESWSKRTRDFVSALSIGPANRGFHSSDSCASDVSAQREIKTRLARSRISAPYSARKGSSVRRMQVMSRFRYEKSGERLCEDHLVTVSAMAYRPLRLQASVQLPVPRRSTAHSSSPSPAAPKIPPYVLTDAADGSKCPGSVPWKALERRPSPQHLPV
jgi:hypothetical protein